MKLMIVNGPNLNFLGIREKGIYGAQFYSVLCDEISAYCEQRGHDTTIVQSNSEGEIIDFLQDAYNEKFDGIIINPGAYTHYSYAIHDAIKSISIPTVEVHLSNVHAREDFRHISVTAPACIGQLCGFGKTGYLLAVQALEEHLAHHIS